MTKIFLYFLTATTIGTSLVSPWIGVMAYYAFAILSPQSIWVWLFRDARFVMAISFATIIGLVIKIFSNKIKFNNLLISQNIYILLMWASLILSYYFSPYGIGKESVVLSFKSGTGDLISSNITNSKVVLSNFNKIFIFYFVSILLITNLKKMYYFVVLIISIIIYYTYWGNNQYFSGNMIAERLGGPSWGGGMYGDENTFAMLFVVSTPFLFFVGKYYQNRIARYFLWGIIPFAWHVVFLTGSLGGLIALGIVTLMMAYLSDMKIMKFIIPIIFIVSFISQGGSYLQNKASTGGGDVTKVSSAQQRLSSWKAGVAMIKDHPITGVGIANYLAAFPDYSDEEPLVAHNTFFQLSSESGILAGVMYLLIFFDAIILSNNRRSSLVNDVHPFVKATRNAVSCSLLGFFVCSLFLNIASYEVLYYLLIINFAQKNIKL